MAATSQLVLYALVVLTSCLCLFNHFRYEDLRNQFSKKTAHAAEKFPSRQRREVVTNFEDLHELRRFIQQTTNGSIQAEVAKVFEKMLLNFANLCKHVKKCDNQPTSANVNNITSKLMGPPGPRGPPGKDGKPGLGLFFPEIKKTNLNMIANESDSKTLTCKIFGNPLPKVRWVHHFRETDTKSIINRTTSETLSFLTVKNISWSDRGIATCVGESILGSANASGRLTVQASPIITLPQGPVLANLGSNFTFPKCNVISEPEAKVTWKRGYGSFPEGRFHVVDGYLTIMKVRVEDEGFYVCTAENYLGKSTRNIQLKSRQLSFLWRPPFLMEVTNTSAILTCSALGAGYQMAGRFFDLYQNKLITVKIIKTTESFTITANVTKSGMYKCVIVEGDRRIETSSNVKFFSLPSSILSRNQISQIGKWLKKGSDFGTYVLCWHSSGGRIDGFSEFHSRCDNKKNVLAIFKYSSSAIFGGYSNAPWKEYSTSRNENSFIFSIEPNMTKVVLSESENPVCYSSSYGPCFGRLELYAYGKNNVYRGRYREELGFQTGGRGRQITSESSGSLSQIEVFYKISY